MKIIVTGATGMVGSEVVRQALTDSDITKVIALVRRPLTIQHSKLEVVIHKDFLDYTSLTNVLKEADACIWCLGVSQLQVSKEEYVKITHDYTIEAANAMMKANPSVSFLFVSGVGADNTEQSKTIFAREKGRTENDLKKLGLKNLYIIRPGSIKPVNSYNNVPFAYKVGYTLIRILYPLVKILSPSLIIKSTEIAKAVLHVCKKGYEQRLIGNKEMIALSRIG
jgi:dTDP-4-dehydrorhamnose reductase